MPDPADLTLDQYMDKLRQEIEIFAAKWRAQHALDPEHWPATMALADWDDQFIAATM